MVDDSPLNISGTLENVSLAPFERQKSTRKSGGINFQNDIVPLPENFIRHKRNAQNYLKRSQKLFNEVILVVSQEIVLKYIDTDASTRDAKVS